VVLHAHHLTDTGAGGTAVVALHGIKGHGARWRRLAQQHTTGLHWIGLDLPGHGHSPVNPPWHLAAHVAAVVETLDALRLDRVDLVGSSFGGLIGVHLARSHPDRVRRLVLVDPALSIPPDLARKGADLELRPIAFASVEEARSWRAQHWPGVTDPVAIDDELADHLFQGEDGQWRWRFNPATIVTAFSEMAIPAPAPPDGLPTLLLVSARNSAVEPSTLASWRSRAELDLTVVDVDCGHIVYLELPEQTGALIQTFLTRP
jgi:lipase